MQRFRSRRSIAVASLAAASTALTGVQPAGAFNLAGWHWSDAQSLTYSYSQGSYGTMPDWARHDVSTAVDGWISAVNNLGISEVGSGGLIDIAPVNSQINCGGTPATGCTQCTSSNGNICTHVHIDFWIGERTSGSTLTCGLNNDRACGGYALNSTGHELGHAWGLDHSCVYNSIMSGPQANCPKEQYNYSESSPQQDDIDGYHAIYPPPPPSPPAPHDCNSAASVLIADLRLPCYD